MYLGLDCGTSGLKALLVNERGQPVASATRTYSPDRPRSGFIDEERYRCAVLFAKDSETYAGAVRGFYDCLIRVEHGTCTVR